ncbi:helix-turn-helix domain-containing protein [Flammeovirga yaeyamensis]|uniref:Helix-turn-helix domain-containing protein n=1 Tax=Flammeovirga yaeyamensis TaxID=367791 RepID=A0AAX1N3A1_9BACT|nr:AraC family transcriptional regulator [Flammeovirga yaeyamensis]MBB3700195.1 AraC-like DNA-binding protein [Flammeovirga yaeyamensis]NMF37175.1 AraC family transcriptional regulator [Flammeovirga yaeyamensis]QWG00866.1 helix-turn-helix domain-containing protein [Flammeovirga yaeyamensis]
MITQSLQRIFEIHIEELSVWEKRPHKHNFFEIVYIEKGSGYQCINDHEFEYKEGNIFLLPPLDCHSFKIKETTRFMFIRFTDHYFMNSDGKTDYNRWFEQISYIIAHYNKVAGDIISSESERQFLIQNLNMIYRESLKTDVYSKSIINSILVTVLELLGRNIEEKYLKETQISDSKFTEILRFINQNITNTEQLKIPYLAEKFNVSKTYFSEYFKKNAQMSLVDYIIKAKLRIVETKIKHTDLSLKEIAYQLNFTDSSHLSKSFKKMYGMSIRDFRNTQVC